MPARFLYARFAAGNQKSALDWVRTVDELALVFAASTEAAPSHREQRTSDPLVTWRLVSENRREIARGCRLFRSEAPVHADILRLLRSVDELDVHTAPAPRLRSTGWFVTHGADLVMMGARRYEKRSAAEQAAALALRAVRELALTSTAPSAVDGPAGAIIV